jgi:ADP-ribose pyrophosphatase YjhB (NUDIX family)
VKFCSDCGSRVRVGVPEGDSLPRHICDACSAIHYQNPKLIVGCLPLWEGRILLCKRSIEPRLGYWTIPSGFMENGETAEEGALREMREEALAEGRIDRLFAIYSLPAIDQVYLLYLAHLAGPEFGPGAETEECRLVVPREIPWPHIAFRAVAFALEKFLDEDARAQERAHIGFHAGSLRSESPSAS